MIRYDGGNFVFVKWKDLKKGDVVWLEGSHMGLGCFYGPHTSSDPEKRELKNSEGRKFLHYPDDLCVEINKPIRR